MEVILVGGFIETIELILSNNKIKLVGIIDKSAKLPQQYKRTIPYLGNDKLVYDAKFLKKYSACHYVISPDLPAIRKDLFNKYDKVGLKLTNLQSLKANISDSAVIGQNVSTIIQGLSNISSNVKIGKCVKINTMANVMHDCIVGDFVSIAPNAVLLGRVTVGVCSYIGANATILPGIHIGKNVMVGAGAVVTKDIPDNSVFVGNPAKKINKK